MTEWGLRARVAVSDYFAVAVVVALLVALLGGWLVYTTHVDPGVETEPEVQGTWQSTAEYDHAATVTEENRVFPTGSTLKDRSTYYTRITPELSGTFVYRFDGSDGQLDVDAESELVIRSVGEDDEVLWSVEEPLGNETTTLTSGEELRVPFVLNVSAVNAEIDRIESDLGSSPGETQVFVRSDVTAEGTAAGGPAEHAATYEFSLSPGSDTYSVAAPDKTEQHQRVERVTREVEYGLLRLATGPLLLLLGLLGTVGLAVGWATGWTDVTEGDRTALATAADREKFDDWISRGSVSLDGNDRQVVEIASLEDLVDVAIDADARVVEDVDDGRYYVLTGAACYTYGPPGAPDVDQPVSYL